MRARRHLRMLTAGLLAALALLAAAGLAGVAGFAAGQAWQRAQPANDTPRPDYPTALRAAALALRTDSYDFETSYASVFEPAAAGSPTPSPTAAADSLRFLTQGTVRPDGFYAAIHRLTSTNPNPTTANLEFEYLVKDGQPWRNDGKGWAPYLGTPPGIGMDPGSAALLPELLVHLSDVRALATDAAHPGLTGWAGNAEPIDYPGIVSSGGVAVTVSPVLVSVWLDGQGRLAVLEAQAANSGFLPDRIDVSVSTHVTRASSFALPGPSPLASTDPSPAASPAASPSASASSASPAAAP